MVTVAADEGHPHTELTVDKLKHIGLMQSEQMVFVSVTVGQSGMGITLLTWPVEIGVSLIPVWVEMGVALIEVTVGTGSRRLALILEAVPYEDA